MWPFSACFSAPCCGRVTATKRQALQGTLYDQHGAPLANQPVLIEGTAAPSWAWFGTGLFFSPKKSAWLAVTDPNGAIELLDLPAGTYTLKMRGRDDAFKPVSHFTLESGYTTKTFTEKIEVSDTPK